MTNNKYNQRESYLFDRATINDIQRASKEGIYKIRGFGAKMWQTMLTAAFQFMVKEELVRSIVKLLGGNIV